MSEAGLDVLSLSLFFSSFFWFPRSLTAACIHGAAQGMSRVMEMRRERCGLAQPDEIETPFACARVACLSACRAGPGGGSAHGWVLFVFFCVVEAYGLVVYRRVRWVPVQTGRFLRKDDNCKK